MAAEPGLVSPTRAFLARVFVDEESLFNFLLFERVAVPSVLVLLMFASDASRTEVLAATAFVIWELVTSLLMKGQLRLLRTRSPRDARPLLMLCVEQIACIAVFLGVGAWRGAFYYTLASPIVLAAVFVGTRSAVFFASICSVVVVTAIAIFHMPDGRGPKDATTVQDWAGAPQLFLAAAILISLIRVLLDEVAVLGARAAAGEASLSRIREAIADEGARKALTRELHRDVRNALSAMATRWQMLATHPRLASNAQGLREVATLAQETGAQVKAILVDFRPTNVDPPRPFPAAEEAGVLQEVHSRQRDYFNAIVIVRLVMASCLVFFLFDARGARFAAIVELWIALMCWVVGSTIAMKRFRLYERLRKRPHLLLVEEAIGASLLMFGTSRNGNPFWIIGATAPVLATAVGTMTQALAYGVISAVAAVASIFMARWLGWQSPPSASGTIAATIGYFGLVLPAVYVRYLFGRLVRDGERLDDDAREIERLRPRLALDRARRTASPQIVARVRPVVEALRAQLANLTDETGPIRFERERVEGLAQTLAGLEGERGGCDFAPSARNLADAVENAIERLRKLGGTAALTTEIPAVALSAPRGEALAGVFAEALTNAHQHGRAPIALAFCRAGSSVEVTITDHGEGFDFESEVARNGLWILRSLAGLADATANIGSDETGTRVRVMFDV
jgi:signal transduction histidine kinase